MKTALAREDTVREREANSKRLRKARYKARYRDTKRDTERQRQKLRESKTE